jgi:hypothetical protein
METYAPLIIARVVRTGSVFLLLALLILSSPFIPDALSDQQVGAPRQLQEWIPWVLYKQEEKTCILSSDDASKRFCSWPSRLVLDIAGNGADFRQEWLVETKILVPLPGSRKLWPESVKDATKNAIVVDHNGTPSVWLDPGSHTLSGRFNWEQSPEYIDIPPASGLVSWKSTTPETPHLDNEGKLWLKGQNEVKTTELDQTSVQVFRKIQDTFPLLEDLHIILTVSGAPREITLGLMAKESFLPLQITSPLPARMDQDGRLSLQARPGQWQIDLVIRDTGSGPPEKLGVGAIDGIWPESEVWVFEAFPKFRQVTVENVPAIDPSRTALPANWMNLPAYLINRQDIMNLVEKSRGNPQTIPDRLTLSRSLWLDEKGTGLTVQDVINGAMTKGWRLNVVPEQHLGKVDVDGETQLITRLPDSDLIGVEVRKGNISLTADSRIEQPVYGATLTFPALGWNHPVQQLTAKLNLPPGWKLLAASGIDKAPTWINKWTLLDIFLVVIISFATGKILGWSRGCLALIALIIMYHQPESPRHLWLPLLALLAVGTKITSKRGMTFIRPPIFMILVLLLLQSVPFMIREIRIGIFPQLEKGPFFQISTDAINTAQKAKMEALDAAKIPSSPPSGRMYNLQMSPSPVSQALPERSDKEMQIDPQAMLQTGPGLLNWQWQSLALTWNGPVNPTQKIRLVLLSPAVNCVLAFLRVGLLIVLLIEFSRWSLRLLPKKMGTGNATGTLFACLLFTLLLLCGMPPSSVAEIPSQEMLQELQDRLLTPPDCQSECASIASCRFSVQDEKLHVNMTIHAAADTAVALPGDSRTFSQILLDNVPAAGIRTESGSLLLRLPQGIHQVSLEKDMLDISELSLTFPLLPHRAFSSPGNWGITGLHPDGTMEKQVTLRRTEKKNMAAQRPPGQEIAAYNVKIPPFFQVERTLHLGLKWTIETRIIRRNHGNIITAEIPLIPGEMPTSESLYVVDRKVQINLGLQDSSISWQSVLQAGESITLTAPGTTDWAETWYLDISPIWHVTATGIPEVSQTNPAGLRFPEFRPYPGESMTLAINRPEGVAGPTMTITTSLLSLQPGMRATDSRLNFSLHASRGARHTITLPVDSELQKVLLNDKEYPLQLSGNQLTLPIQPGNQRIEIQWRNKNGVATRLYTPLIDLGIENVNSTLQIEMPASRWILMAGGPRVGPAVLFWGEIAVIIMLAFLLGRIRITPLTTGQWILLGLGLSQVHVIFGAIVVGWLFLLGLRKQKGPAIVYESSFNLLQMVIVAVTVCACISLIYAVQKGLLGDPDMQIGGNGSFGRSLHWYQDRNSRILPQAWVLSVPLPVYRVIMLAWALWLALALLKWLSWGWSCFSDGGTWRKKVQPPEQQAKGSETETKHEEPGPAASPVPSVGKSPRDSTNEEIPPHKRSWFSRLRKKQQRPGAQ